MQSHCLTSDAGKHLIKKCVDRVQFLKSTTVRIDCQVLCRSYLNLIQSLAENSFACELIKFTFQTYENDQILIKLLKDLQKNIHLQKQKVNTREHR